MSKEKNNLNDTYYTGYNENEDYTKPEDVEMIPGLSNRTYRKLLAINISLCIFTGIMLGIVSTYIFINFVSREITFSFSAFLAVFSAALMIKVCKKHQKNVKTFNMVLFTISALLYGICVFFTQYVKSFILFICLFIIASIFAIITVYLFKEKTKKYFIPILAVFFLLSILNASEQLSWFKNQVEFSAEYFYVSSKLSKYPNDQSNYYSRTPFTEEEFEKGCINHLNIITNEKEMYSAFYDIREKNTNLIIPYDSKGMSEKIAGMISISKTKYDENFFKKNNLLIVNISSFYPIQKNEIKEIYFKGSKANILYDVYTNYYDYRKINENTSPVEICVALVAIDKSYDIPKFIRDGEITPNIIFND